MSIQPKGESIRKAVKWISGVRRENPEMSIEKNIEKACIQFDISPKDSEFLRRMLQEENKKE